MLKRDLILLIILFLKPKLDEANINSNYRLVLFSLPFNAPRNLIYNDLNYSFVIYRLINVEKFLNNIFHWIEIPKLLNKILKSGGQNEI